MSNRSTGKVNKEYDPLVELQRAEKLAKDMQEMKMDFASTLVAHMVRLELTNEMVAEGAGLSTRSITTYRNDPDYPIEFKTVFCLCISLQLGPGLSDELINKAGYAWKATKQHQFLREMLHKYYRKDISWWREQLKCTEYGDLIPEE